MASAILPSLLQLAVAATLLGLAASTPSVTLDNGTFVGISDGVTDRFLGIPFALPPVGNLRLNLPIPNYPYNGTHNASSFGFWCPQQTFPALTLPSALDPDFLARIVDAFTAVGSPQSEDCLTLNLWRPSGLPPSASLPVVAWIHGGGFEVGGSEVYDGGMIVERSIQLGEPIIYISMNYRIGAFGFLGGQEVKDAGVGNLGLQDQRQALRWINQYVHAFGGDPEKVTLWGQSAGAMSVGSQMVANGGDTEGLFRAAFMHSGSLYFGGDITDGQQQYNEIVSSVGCANDPNSTLGCLRTVPYSQLLAAMHAIPNYFESQTIALTWPPRADNGFLLDQPRLLVSQGHIADIPFVIGDCRDEGTLFALGSLDITTDQQLQDYLSSKSFPNANSSALNQLLVNYPADPDFGSPFHTGGSNAVTPQYKRIAAIIGDVIFQGPRRLLLQRSNNQPAWSFVSEAFGDEPVLGAAHVTDMFNAYGPGDLTDRLINFVNYLNPNGATQQQRSSGPYWPQYDLQMKNVLSFNDGSVPSVTQDTFREEEIDFVNTFTQANPL